MPTRTRWVDFGERHERGKCEVRGGRELMTYSAEADPTRML